MRYIVPGAGARAILCPARAISPEGSKKKILKILPKVVQNLPKLLV